MTQFEIPTANLNRLAEKIEALNRKAPRLGAEPIKLSIGERFNKTFYTELLGEPYTRSYVMVEIVGERPMLNGWTFVAKIEPHGEGVNMVKLLPGVESVPTQYRSTGMTCDHCGHNRHRNEVFLVQHDSGTYKQVGRNCLADFIGGMSPETMARRAEWLIEARGLGDEDWDGLIGGTTSNPTVNTIAFLTLVEATARKYGFVKRSDVGKGEPTADIVWSYLIGSMDRERMDYYTSEVVNDVSDRDVSTATKVIEWARAQTNAKNDFLYNLSVAARNEDVDRRSIGILAAAIPSYYRAMEWKRENERKDAGKPVSQHVGTIGRREEFTVTVTRVHHFEGQYGTTHYISMVDPNGNNLLWKASVCPWWAEEGSTLRIKGTVKAHDEFRGTAQTLINRVTEV